MSYLGHAAEGSEPMKRRRVLSSEFLPIPYAWKRLRELRRETLSTSSQQGTREKFLLFQNGQYKGAVIAKIYFITLICVTEYSKSYRHRRHFTAARFLTIQSRWWPTTRWWSHGVGPRRCTPQVLRWSRSGHLSCHAQGYSTRRRDAALPHALCPARQRCDLRQSWTAYSKTPRSFHSMLFWQCPRNSLPRTYRQNDSVIRDMTQPYVTWFIYRICDIEPAGDEELCVCVCVCVCVFSCNADLTMSQKFSATQTHTYRHACTYKHRDRDREMDIDRHTDTQTHRHIDTQTHRHTDTQTTRHTDTQTHRHTDTQTQRHTDTQTQRHTDTQTQRHTDTQTHRHADAQTRRHADTPTHRHTDTPTHRHTDTPTHRHTDTPTHRHTDTQTHRHTDTHTHTWKVPVDVEELHRQFL